MNLEIINDNINEKLIGLENLEKIPPIPLTPEQELLASRLKKIIEYRKSPITFFKEQCYIRHPKKGMIKFKVFPAQEKCVHEFKKNRFNIILKSRQLGISTIVAAYCLWKAVFHSHQEIRIIATKKETAQIIVRMAWDMLNNLEQWILELLGATKISDRKHTVELKNGSKIQSHGQAKGENPDTGVGSALSLLVIDECALIPNIGSVWTTVYPTLSQGGDCIILSTPRGMDNWFYDMYVKAEIKEYEPGEEPFNPIKLMWWENTDRILPPETPLVKDPHVIGGYTNSWAKRTFANLTPKEASQEYLCIDGSSMLTIQNENRKTFNITIEELYNLKEYFKYKVLTKDGFKNFDNISKRNDYSIKIQTENNEIICSFTHPFIVDGNIILAQDLKINDYLETKNGLEKIKNINKNNKINLFDLINVDETHSFYANNILVHNCDFTMSGESALPAEQIAFIKSEFQKDPIGFEGSNKEFWIFEYPQPNVDYIISADTGKGDGTDYSAAQIIRVDRLEQVAEFKSRIPSDRFGQLLCKWGMDYNSALVIPENNATSGGMTVQKIIDLQYPNLFWFDKRFKGLVFPELNEQSMGKQEPGWITTSRTRPIILENLLKLLREVVQTRGMGGIIIHSSRFIAELRTWGYHGPGGRLDHQKGENKHDDLIVAMAIGAFVKSVYNKISTNAARDSIEFMKVLMNEKQNVDMTFGIQNNPRARIQNNYNFEGENIDWLLKD